MIPLLISSDPPTANHFLSLSSAFLSQIQDNATHEKNPTVSWVFLVFLANVISYLSVQLYGEKAYREPIGSEES
jgi:hypothetical protein